LIDPHVALIRIGLALVFGAVVGVEREWRHKTAGIKTNTLVAIGASSFALMSNTFGEMNHNPAQLAAAVVSGIGFIGAGVIIHRGANVQGVTTAATLWANASMAVALGLGYVIVGSTIFVGIVVTQFGLRRAVVLVAAKGPRMREIEVRVECSEESLPQVLAAWRTFTEERAVFALRHSTVRRDGAVIWRAVFVASPDRGLDLTTIEETLVSVGGVVAIDTRQTTPGDEMP
jgi:uncharacterized membrane protein YhiD involved in acid resistance